MNIFMTSLYILCISFCHYVYIRSCCLIFKTKIKRITLLTGLVFLLITVLTYYNTFYNYNFSKILISFIFLMIIYKITFKEGLKEIFLKLLNVYLIGWIIETLVSIIVGLLVLDLQHFDMMFLKVPLSILIMLLLLLVSHISFFRNMVATIYKTLHKAITLVFVLIFSIIFLVLLSFYYIMTNDNISHIAILFLILVFTFFFVVTMIEIIKVKSIQRNQEVLLTFMKKYETIVDKERVNKHEYLNNLLILKSIKNKNSKEYDEILNEVISNYKVDKTYSRIYNLPSGLKGVLYYKIYDMQEIGLEPFIDISNDAIPIIDDLNLRTFARLCKIFGIILDNAKEAAFKSKEKIVVIDIYKDFGDVVIYVENSLDFTPKEIEIDKIRDKNFSTKGGSRGLGLYLVNQIIKKDKNLFINQKIKNKKFISILKIKAS